MKAVHLIILSLIFPLFSQADTLTVKGMTCRSCEKQVTSLVCQDQEMSKWFETCAAKVTDTQSELGEIRYTLKKDITMDQEKIKKIEKVIVESGRTLEKTSSTEKTLTK